MNTINGLFSREFRAQFSEKLMDLGNIVAGALVFGPFLSKQDFSLSIMNNLILYLLTLGLVVIVAGLFVKKYSK